MGNSKQTGIDITKLESTYNDFFNIPFPSAPEDEDLNDIYGDLVEYDSHIAGIVSSVLGGKQVNKSFVRFGKDLEEKITAKSNHPEIKGIKNYKKRIDILVMLLYKGK